MKSAYLKTTALALALSIAGAGAALADKANDTLRVAYTKELENVDSYFNSSRERARFLCGLSSPRMIRARLSRHPSFGVCDPIPFEVVLGQVGTEQ